MAEQQPLLAVEGEWVQGPVGAGQTSGGRPVARLKRVERNQLYWGQVCLEDLIPDSHIARAIWELSGKLDLWEFLKENRSVEGRQGRDRWDPRVLLSVWVYSYSQGIGSAREIERQMEHEPGLRWLMGNEKVNYHTLSDFRVDHGKALEKLFVELLGVLSQEGLVNLEEVAQDGTKVRAVAGGSSLRRERTLREHLKQAEELVEKLGQENEEETQRRKTKKEAAQRRAAQERQQRLKQALEELEQIRKSARKNGKDEEQARASESEPEARVMKDGHGGFGPSYNVQTTVETSNGIVVGVDVTQQSNDQAQLEPAVERMEQQLGQKPSRVIVDSGYINARSIEAMVEEHVELIGPDMPVDANVERNEKQSLALAGIAAEFSQRYFVVIEEGKAVRCPAGKRLERIQKRTNCTVYQASRQDCGGCANLEQCCPKSKARIVKIRDRRTAAQAHQERMKSEEAKAIYRKRGQVVEFPFAWIKEKLNLRKFHVRGMVKAGIEALWVVLTYDIQQWVRLRWCAAVTPAIAC